MVLLRGVDGRGFCFYTNFDSRKGDELAAFLEQGRALAAQLLELLLQAVRARAPTTATPVRATHRLRAFWRIVPPIDGCQAERARPVQGAAQRSASRTAR